MQPPQEVLEQMLTIRIHLDRSHADNGSLMVIHGSHLQGKLSADQIQAIRAKEAQTLCVADEGDALLMRPLLLHVQVVRRVPIAVESFTSNMRDVIYLSR